MKRILSGFFALAIMTCSLTLYAADSDIVRMPGTVIAESKTEDQAVVRDINLEKRTLTLAMPNGTLKTFIVDEQVKRFETILPGDIVRTTYSDSITVSLRKTKIKPGVKVEESLSPDPDSGLAGKSLRQVTTTATIEAIASDFRSVSLRGPEGKLENVDVRNPSNLDKLRSGEVKVGDQVDIIYTQAVAITLEKVGQGANP